MFNVLKNQSPRTHLALPPSKLRSLLYPPLRHKCVSVWIWTLHQNKHNNLIMLDFTILIGSYKTTEKKSLNSFSVWFYKGSFQAGSWKYQAWIWRLVQKRLSKSWQDTSQSTTTTVTQVLGVTAAKSFKWCNWTLSPLSGGKTLSNSYGLAQMARGCYLVVSEVFALV